MHILLYMCVFEYTYICIYVCLYVFTDFYLFLPSHSFIVLLKAWWWWLPSKFSLGYRIFRWDCDGNRGVMNISREVYKLLSYTIVWILYLSF